jgi:hypothetical protein
VSIASLADLRLQVLRLMDGDNVTSGEVEIATLNQVIGLAERRIYREVRSRHNEKVFSSVSVSSNLAALPNDFEASSVVHFGSYPLEPVAEEWLIQYNVNRTGRPGYFAEVGNSLSFGPPASDGDLVQGRYFFRWPDLTEANIADNTLLQREPDLFIYACLTEGAAFFGKDPAYWEAKYQQALRRVNSDKERAAFAAGRIRIRPSAGVLETAGRAYAWAEASPTVSSSYADDYATEYA